MTNTNPASSLWDPVRAFMPEFSGEFNIAAREYEVSRNDTLKKIKAMDPSNERVHQLLSSFAQELLETRAFALGWQMSSMKATKRLRELTTPDVNPAKSPHPRSSQNHTGHSQKGATATESSPHYNGSQACSPGFETVARSEVHAQGDTSGYHESTGGSYGQHVHGTASQGAQENSVAGTEYDHFPGTAQDQNYRDIPAYRAEPNYTGYQGVERNHVYSQNRGGSSTEACLMDYDQTPRGSQLEHQFTKDPQGAQDASTEMNSSAYLGPTMEAQDQHTAHQYERHTSATDNLAQRHGSFERDQDMSEPWNGGNHAENFQAWYGSQDQYAAGTNGHGYAYASPEDPMGSQKFWAEEGEF